MKRKNLFQPILTKTIMASLVVTASSEGANLLWTTGGDNSGLWDASTFNTQGYITPPDTFNIDGTATKLITLSGAINNTTLTISAIGSSLITSSTPGAGAVTLSGTALGGTLIKSGSADLVLSTANTFGAATISSGKFLLYNAAGLGTVGTLTVAPGTVLGPSGTSYGATNANQFFFDSVNIASSYTFSKNIAFTNTGTAIYGTVLKGGSGYTTTFSGNISGGTGITIRTDTSSSGDATTTYAFTGDNSAFSGTLYNNRGRFLFNSTVAPGLGGISMTTNSSALGNIAFTGNVVLENAIDFGSSGHTVNAAAGQTDILAQTIGTLGFSKNGSGRLVLLSPINTATVQDTVSDGTLAIGGNGRLNSGNLAVTLTLSLATAVFDYASNANQTISKAGIKGLGSVIKSGAGTLTLSGTNTYTGSTTLAFGNTVLAFGAATTPTSNILPTASSLILAGGALTLSGAGTQTSTTVSTAPTSGSSLIMGTGAQTLTLGTLTQGTNSSLLVNTVAGGANGATVGSSTVVLTGKTAGTAINTSFTVLDSGGYGLATVNAANQIVRLTATPVLPATGSNPALDYLVTGAASTVTASETANSITVDTSGAGAAGTLTIGTGKVLSTNVLNLGGTGVAPYAISSGSLTAATPGGVLVINNYLNAGSGAISSVIANNTTASSVVVNGPGLTVLSGVNTYSGGTTLGGGGTLQISGSTSALGTGPLTVTGNATFVSGVSTPTTPIILNSGVVLTMNTGINGFFYNYGGVISGSGAIIANGSTRFSGANTFSGGLTINTSTYFYPSSGDGAFGAVPTSFSPNNITMLNGLISTSSSSANLTINANRGILLASGTNNVGFQPITYSITYGGIIAGSGALYRSTTGTGGIILTGLNNYLGQSQLFTSGVTTINTIKNVGGGDSSLGAPQTVANGTLNFGSVGPATLSYVGTGSTTDRVINLIGTGASSTTLDQSGTGPLVFTSNLTATGSGSGTRNLILSGSTSGTGELAGAIVDPATGSTTLSKIGSGLWTLSGSNTYTGATNVNGGTLAVTGSINGTPTVNVVGGGTLLLSGSGSNLNPTATAVTLGNGTTAGSIRFTPGASSPMQTVNSLTLNANSVVDFGSGNSGATYNAITLVVTPNVPISIYNYNGSGFDPSITSDDGSDMSLNRFLTTTAYTDAQLSQLQFYADSGSTPVGVGGREIAFNGEFEIVPIPEPATTSALTGLALASLAAFRERRRLVRLVRRTGV